MHAIYLNVPIDPVILPVAVIVVDDEMSLPLIDPVVADMFPLVVNMFPAAVIDPFVVIVPVVQFTPIFSVQVLSPVSDPSDNALVLRLSLEIVPNALISTTRTILVLIKSTST